MLTSEAEVLAATQAVTWSDVRVGDGAHVAVEAQAGGAAEHAEEEGVSLTFQDNIMPSEALFWILPGVEYYLNSM